MKSHPTLPAVTRRSLCERLGLRRGSSTVELAFVLPVFGIFLAAMVEISHASMTRSTLRAACQKGGRIGVAETVTTAEVRTEVEKILKVAFPSAAIQVYVKDGSSFDDASAPPPSDYSKLSDVELKNLDHRHLFIVRAEVAYADVSLIPPFFVKGSGGGPATLAGHAVMRRE